jgi:ribosomal protein L7/L12
MEAWIVSIAFGIGVGLLLLRHFELAPPLAHEPSERVKQIAANPRKKIEAIRAFREETGLGLKEAKAIIEEVIANQGMNRA